MLLAMLLAGSPVQTQADLNQQAVTEWERVDAAMNAQYRDTLAVMKRSDVASTPDGRLGYFAALLASQRAWLTHRDADCVVEGYGMRGGSAENAVHESCLARLTRARTAWLKEQAE